MYELSAVIKAGNSMKYNALDICRKREFLRKKEEWGKRDKSFGEGDYLRSSIYPLLVLEITRYIIALFQVVYVTNIIFSQMIMLYYWVDICIVNKFLPDPVGFLLYHINQIRIFNKIFNELPFDYLLSSTDTNKGKKNRAHNDKLQQGYFY